MAKTRQEILDLISQLQEELRQVGSDLRSKQYIELIEAHDFVKAMKRFSDTDATVGLDKLNFPTTSRFPWDRRGTNDRYTCAIFQNTGYTGYKQSNPNEVAMVGYYAGGQNGFSIGDSSDPSYNYYEYNGSRYNFMIHNSNPRRSWVQANQGDSSWYSDTQYRPVFKYDERENM